MARPSKYKLEFAKQAAVACKLGATDQDLSELFSVSRSTVNLWKIEFLEFSDALKDAKTVADARVERALYQKAVGYSHPEDDIKMYEGQVIITPTVKHYPPDTTACIFWLKNRMPEQYRANPEDDGGSGADKLVKAVADLIDKLPN